MLRHINAAIAWTAISLLALLSLATTVQASTGIGFSPGGRVTISSAGRLTFTGGAVRIECNITLTASFASSVVKVAGTSLGSVTAATVSGCPTGTSMAFLFTSPTTWPMTYNSFAGTLPSISNVSLTLSGGQISFTTSTTGTCLYTGSLGGRFTPPNALAIDAGNSWTRSAGGALCPSSGRWSGSFGVTPNQTLNLI